MHQRGLESALPVTFICVLPCMWRVILSINRGEREVDKEGAMGMGVGTGTGPVMLESWQE